MSKKNIITIAVSVFILASLLTVFYINKAKSTIPPNGPNVVGNTSGNLYNGGYFCEKNGYVYFANSYDNGALYRMKSDESDMTRLLSTETEFINVDDHYIFYSMKGSGSGEGFGYVIDSHGVNRATLDGKETATLIKNRVNSLLLLGNDLYYDDQSDQSNIVMARMDISTREPSTILDHKVNMSCTNQGNIYYNDTSGSFNLKSFNPMSNSHSVYYSEDVYQPIVFGSEIFFIDIHNNYALCKVNLVTKEKIVLDSDRTDMFNVSSKYVYYQTSGKTPQFKRVSLDGTSMDVIKEGAHNSISITSRYVYFKEYNNKLQTYKIDLDGSLFVSEFTRAKNAALGLLK